jgi:hypothetical protein
MAAGKRAKGPPCKIKQTMRSILVQTVAINLLIQISGICGISFEAPAWSMQSYEGKDRCFSMFVSPHSLVTGSASAGPAFHMTTRVRVTDVTGNVVWSTNDLGAEMKFSFKTHNNPSDYSFCVVNVLSSGKLE